MKLQASKTREAVIPTATMADIAFLLIIFFMLTMTYEVDKTRVTLPKTVVREEVPKKSAYISITEAGHVRVSTGEEMSVNVPDSEAVLSFASRLVAEHPEREVVIKADSTVPYSEVDKVIDALKRAKVRTIYLLSKAEGGPGGDGAG